MGRARDQRRRARLVAVGLCAAVAAALAAPALAAKDDLILISRAAADLG